MAAIKSQLSSAVTIASGAATLSGLGLVVSIAGFAFMHARLSAVKSQLSDVAKTVKRIERLINEQQLAALRAAIDAIRHAERSKDADVRRGLLLQAQSELAKASYYYGDLWGKPPDDRIEVLDLLNDYYTLAFTGAAIAASELRMPEDAADNFKKHFDLWLDAARNHVKRHLLESDIVLYFDKPADLISTSEMVRLMDFAHGERRGIEWVDDLRRRRSNLPNPTNWPRDFTPSIKLSQKLLARASVAEAESAHLRFLADKGLSVSAFLQGAKTEMQRLHAPALCLCAESASAETPLNITRGR